MAVGGFLAALGYALVFGGPSLANLVYGANSFGGSEPISVADAFSASFWLVWTGIVLFPVGVATFAYAIGAKESSRRTEQLETATPMEIQRTS